MFSPSEMTDSLKMSDEICVVVGVTEDETAKVEKRTHLYRWEEYSGFRAWLSEDPAIPSKSFCNLCEVSLTPRLSAIQKHAKTIKHKSKEIKMKANQNGQICAALPPPDHFAINNVPTSETASDDDNYEQRWLVGDDVKVVQLSKPYEPGDDVKVVQPYVSKPYEPGDDLKVVQPYVSKSYEPGDDLKVALLSKSYEPSDGVVSVIKPKLMKKNYEPSRRVHLQRWEEMQGFRDWLIKDPTSRTNSYCTVCRMKLAPRISVLQKHGESIRHKGNQLQSNSTQKLPGEFEPPFCVGVVSADESPPMITTTITHRKPPFHLHEWEELDCFKSWLAPDPYRPNKSFCKICQISLAPRFFSIQRHMDTQKHRERENDCKNKTPFTLHAAISNKTALEEARRLVDAAKHNSKEEDAAVESRVAETSVEKEERLTLDNDEERLAMAEWEKKERLALIVSHHLGIINQLPVQKQHSDEKTTTMPKSNGKTNSKPKIAASTDIPTQSRLNIKEYERFFSQIEKYNGDVLQIKNLVQLIDYETKFPNYEKKIKISDVVMPVDLEATKVLLYFKEKNYIAFKATANGNCLFNAISTALFGNEYYSLIIRFVTLKYMATYYDAITIIQPTLATSDDMTKTFRDCAANLGWSNVLTIYCVAQAMRITINAIYPPHNGICCSNFLTVPKVFTPLCGGQKNEIFILWTTTTVPDEDDDDEEDVFWQPNHFVPLVHRTTTTTTSSSSSGSEEDCSSDIRQICAAIGEDVPVFDINDDDSQGPSMKRKFDLTFPGSTNGDSSVAKNMKEFGLALLEDVVAMDSFLKEDVNGE